MVFSLASRFKMGAEISAFVDGDQNPRGGIFLKFSGFRRKFVIFNGVWSRDESKVEVMDSLGSALLVISTKHEAFH